MIRLKSKEAIIINVHNNILVLLWTLNVQCIKSIKTGDYDSYIYVINILKAIAFVIIKKSTFLKLITHNWNSNKYWLMLYWKI